MKASEILARLNGVSTPFGGVSWVPPTSDVQVARKVIAFVEVRRVLFSTYSNEVPDQCVASVIEIRDFLTDLIGAGGIGDDLDQALRLARRYSVRFLERVGATEASLPTDASTRHLFREPRCKCTTTGSERPSANSAPESASRSESSRRNTSSISTTISPR